MHLVSMSEIAKYTTECAGVWCLGDAQGECSAKVINSGLHFVAKAMQITVVNLPMLMIGIIVVQI